VCSGNKEAYDYILDWHAHLCQYPNKKTGVMIALMSTKQGAGKNIFWNFIGRHIIGKQYFMVLNDLDQLTGKFNGVNENKILTVCDEIGNFGGAYRSNDKLKNIITQDDQIIERKGFDAASVADYNNFVGFSNNEWPWKIESGDRRHLVLEVSNEKVGDKDYFDRLALLSTDECGEQFYNMLLRRDITHWNPLNIPMTQFKRDLNLMSLSAPILYMKDCLEDEPVGFVWLARIRHSANLLK
jgi:putative DNA primase/helicase